MKEDKSVLIDTNILIYSTLVNSPFHSAAKKKLTQLFEDGFALWVSRQILREYLVVKSNLLKLNNIYDEKLLLADIETFHSQYIIADENEAVTFHLKNLIEKYKVVGKKIHDCNIYSTALCFNITHLLTNNISDFTLYKEGIELISLS